MKRGFTLIELMVVVSISMVLGGIILVNYTTYTENQRNYQTVKTLVANLNYARTRAITGDKPGGCSGNLEYYQVQYDPTNNNFSYTISARCSGPDSTVAVQTISFPSTINISPFTIQFLPLNAGTTLPNNYDIYFKYGEQIYYKISIAPSGSITESKITE